VAGSSDHLRWAVAALPLDAHDAHGLDLAAAVAEILRHHRVVARVGAESRDRLFVRVVRAQDLRPQRPRIVGRAFRRRFVEQLEVHEARAAVAKRRADAVRAGVARRRSPRRACLR